MIRHVFVINLAGRGYSTFAGGPAMGFEEQPMGVVTARVSETTLSVIEGLDDAARVAPSRRSLAACRDRRGAIVVALGAHLAEARDEKGRGGLVFLHALELGVGDDLPDVVTALLTATAAFPRLDHELAALASCTDDPLPLLMSLAAEVERRASLSPTRTPHPATRPIARVEHDLVGAPVVAWMALALRGAAFEAPWRLRDRYDPGGAWTTLEPAAGDAVRASSLLVGGLRRALMLDGAAEEPGTWPDRPAPAPHDDAPTVVTPLHEILPQREPGAPAVPVASRSKLPWAVAAGSLLLALGVAVVAWFPGARSGGEPPTGELSIVPTRAPARPALTTTPRDAAVVAPAAPPAPPAVTDPDASPGAPAPVAPPASASPAPVVAPTRTTSRTPPRARTLDPDDPPRPE